MTVSVGRSSGSFNAPGSRIRNEIDFDYDAYFDATGKYGSCDLTLSSFASLDHRSYSVFAV